MLGLCNPSNLLFEYSFYLPRSDALFSNYFEDLLRYSARALSISLKMATGCPPCILYSLDAHWNHLQRVFGGLYRYAKCCRNRCSNFENMKVWIFCALGWNELKSPIHGYNWCAETGSRPTRRYALWYLFQCARGFAAMYWTMCNGRILVPVYL